MNFAPIESTSNEDMREALAAYPSHIHPYLLPFDTIRYDIIPAQLRTTPYLSKNALLALTDWKLAHGKFRPALRGFVARNSEASVQDTTKRAIELYREKPEDVKAPLKILCELSGVGPATASLVLSCADPEGTVFFSDEAARWVCGMRKLKYTVTEYMELWGQVREFKEHLGMSATEIEKAAFACVLKSIDQGDVGNGARFKDASGVWRHGELERDVLEKSIAAGEREDAEKGGEKTKEKDKPEKVNNKPTKKSVVGKEAPKSSSEKKRKIENDVQGTRRSTRAKKV